MTEPWRQPSKPDPRIETWHWTFYQCGCEVDPNCPHGLVGKLVDTVRKLATIVQYGDIDNDREQTVLDADALLARIDKAHAPVA